MAKKKILKLIEIHHPDKIRSLAITKQNKYIKKWANYITICWKIKEKINVGGVTE